MINDNDEERETSANLIKEENLKKDWESAVATTRRLPSDSGVFADWVASSSAAGRAFPDDLSLGFNAGPTAATDANTGPSSGLWPATSRQINYSLSPEVGMLGLRDLFVVAPASSFHSHESIISDPHSIVGSNPGTALGVGVGVGLFPLLATAPCLAPSNVGGVEDQNIGHRIRGGGIQLWHNQQPNHDNYFRKPTIDNHSSGNSENGGAIGSAATCQDCGNQAKKDCNHRRCRTCCKSRGFDCSTHVKSTWVPAARRRERQMITAGSSGSTSGSKKPRLVTSQTTTISHTSASNTTPPRSYETTSSHPADGTKETLPGQVRAPAVFKCVRVTAVEDEEDEYAYQAVVRIGGHVFKGFLYDQGAESREVFPNISDLHLNGAVGHGKNGASSTSPLLHPTDIFGTSGSAAAATAFLGGSSYGNGV